MTSHPNPDTLTIGELWILWRKFAKGHYRKPQSRRATGTLDNVRYAFRDVRILYRSLLVKDFTVDHMENVRDRMISCGKSRRYINEQMARIRGVFRWGHKYRWGKNRTMKLVPVEVLVSIACVTPLGIGRSDAKEKPKLKSVKPEAIRATLPKMPSVPCDMVQVILLTGMRPGECCSMTAAEIDQRDKNVWVYMPTEHKTEHYEKERVIYIGPMAQEILQPYLLKNQFIPNLPLFSHQRKKSATKGFYTTDALSQAVRRACTKAGVNPRWCPLQLRHTRATAADIEAGHEVARQVLGHSDVKTTHRYIDENYELAKRYQAKHG